MRTQIIWMLWVFNGGYLNIIMWYMSHARNNLPYLQCFWLLIFWTISYMKPLDDIVKKKFLLYSINITWYVFGLDNYLGLHEFWKCCGSSMGISEHNNVVQFMRTKIIWMLWVFNGGYLNIIMWYNLWEHKLFEGIITVNPPEVWLVCALPTRGSTLITLPTCTSIHYPPVTQLIIRR